MMTISAPPSPQAKPQAPAGVHPTSLKWAAIVPLSAVIMLGLFIAINALFPDPKQAAVALPKLEKITGLHTNAVPAFTHYVVNGIPPANIVNSVFVPQEAGFTGEINTGGEAASYDRRLGYSSAAAEGALYSYFHTVMTAEGWKIFSISAPTGSQGVELLAQKAGDDGFYWEQGVVIHPTTFAANGTQSTSFSVRLYQAAAE
jgi:hypothetical protein